MAIEKDSIYEALDGNWVNDQMGALEELQEAVSLLREALGDKEFVTYEQARDALSGGSRLRRKDD